MNTMSMRYEPDRTVVVLKKIADYFSNLLRHDEAFLITNDGVSAIVKHMHKVIERSVISNNEDKLFVILDHQLKSFRDEMLTRSKQDIIVYKGMKTRVVSEDLVTILFSLCPDDPDFPL